MLRGAWLRVITCWLRLWLHSLRHRCHTDMKERYNQGEYFPDTLQAEATVSAVTSLLEENGWTSAVPCGQRKPLGKGVPALEEATTIQKYFFLCH